MFGTCLHGDKRGSVDRFHNVYGTPKLGPVQARVRYERKLMTRAAVRLNAKQRTAVARGVREGCEKRGWDLWVVTPRTNHVQSVVTATSSPKKALSTLKTYTTKAMRESGVGKVTKVHGPIGEVEDAWGRKKSLVEAIADVLYDQGPPLPDDD